MKDKLCCYVCDVELFGDEQIKNFTLGQRLCSKCFAVLNSKMQKTMLKMREATCKGWKP